MAFLVKILQIILFDTVCAAFVGAIWYGIIFLALGVVLPLSVSWFCGLFFTSLIISTIYMMQELREDDW